MENVLILRSICLYLFIIISLFPVNFLKIWIHENFMSGRGAIHCPEKIFVLK